MKSPDSTLLKIMLLIASSSLAVPWIVNSLQPTDNREFVMTPVQINFGKKLSGEYAERASYAALTYLKLTCLKAFLARHRSKKRRQHVYLQRGA